MEKDGEFPPKDLTFSKSAGGSGSGFYGGSWEGFEVADDDDERDSPLPPPPS